MAALEHRPRKGLLSFETVDEDTDGTTSVESTLCGEATSDDGENDIAEPPAFSPEALVHWLYGRCTRRELPAAANRDPQRGYKYQQRKSILQEMLTYPHHASPEEYENASTVCFILWMIRLQMRILQMLLIAHSPQVNL